MRAPLAWALCLAFASIAAAEPADGADPAQGEQAQLRRLSIEELMQIDVTIASRQAEPIRSAPAAVSVITAEDIRRAGVTTIADALLLADGMHVARFNNGSWSITARGFNGTTPNKLLVMVNGRTVYSPLFTGVFWNTLDYVLEDLDRIEVIHGPGATLWGANALNGVVNIVTRSARDTQGGYVSLSSGTEDRGIVEARYGGMAGASTAWRIYSKFAARDAQAFSTGGAAGDDRRRGQVGLRVDGGNPDAASWFLTADAFHSRDHLPDRATGEFTDLSLQARWSNVMANASRVQVQSYYRREYRRVPLQLTHHIDVFDLDAQHAFRLDARNELIWGGGARLNVDNTHGSAVIRFDPVSRNYPVFNVFAQDTLDAFRNRLSITAGAKWEHNAFSGGALQPSVRAGLQLPGGDGHMVWGAVTRGVRRPTRFDDDLEVMAPTGAVLVRGSDDFESEWLTSAEGGYRIQPVVMVSFDVVAFEHRFRNLRSQEAPLVGALPITLGNTLEGRSRGVTVAANLQPIPAWRTHVSYSRLATTIERQPGSRDVSGGVSEMNDPAWYWSVRSGLDLPRQIEVDMLLRSVAALPNPAVPSFTELNVRGGWQMTPRLDLWIVGHDLLHAQHPEFGSPAPRRVEFQRGVRAGATMRF